MSVSEATYLAVSLEDPSTAWELWCGELRRKPCMTMPHNTVTDKVGFLLNLALEGLPFEVRIQAGRARRGEQHYFVPDIMVIPIESWRRQRDNPRALEVYPEPLALIVEVWSASTGDYDVDEKLPEYQQRGDQEIWRLHPYERSLVAWRRRPDGGYTRHEQSTGHVVLAGIPSASIDLDRLWAYLDR